MVVLASNSGRLKQEDYKFKASPQATEQMLKGQLILYETLFFKDKHRNRGEKKIEKCKGLQNKK